MGQGVVEECMQHGAGQKCRERGRVTTSSGPTLSETLERSQDALAVQPSPLKMPLAAESYYAAVGSFCLCPAHALQAILHHRKEAGKCVLCRHVS